GRLAVNSTEARPMLPVLSTAETWNVFRPYFGTMAETVAVLVQTVPDGPLTQVLTAGISLVGETQPWRNLATVVSVVLRPNVATVPGRGFGFDDVRLTVTGGTLVSTVNSHHADQALVM